MNLIVNKIKEIWEALKLSDHKVLVEHFRESQEILKDLKNIVQQERDMIERELVFYKSLAEAVVYESPDMVWLKDTEGKYMMANNAIRENLLCNCEVIGKTDVELAKAAKAKYGEDQHTFGELCENSDKIVIEVEEPRRFLESGKVKGKMLYLEVFKFPFYVDGVLSGVAGVGRDMTEYVEAYRAHDCGSCPLMADIFARYEFKG